MSDKTFRFTIFRAHPGEPFAQCHLSAPIIILPLDIPRNSPTTAYPDKVELALATLKLELIKQISAAKFEVGND